MNWEALLTAGVAALPATIAAVAALVQATKTHKAVNSRMTELLELTRRASRAEGTLEEKDAEQIRKGDAAIAERSKP